MRTWLARLGPFIRGVLGGVLGVLVVLAGLHLVQLYLALQQVIQFINVYGPKIQRLP